MSAASFISMAGLISNMGYGGGLFLMGWTGGYVLLAMLLAPYLRKFGKFTVPQFIGDRFYSKTASTVAVLCLLVGFADLHHRSDDRRGRGLLALPGCDLATPASTWAWASCSYAVFGGMKGITYTQVAQYMRAHLGLHRCRPSSSRCSSPATPIPQLGLGSTIVGGRSVSLLHKLDMVVKDLGFAKYTTSDAGWHHRTCSCTRCR
jgi:cation/acetate symporter